MNGFRQDLNKKLLGATEYQGATFIAPANVELPKSVDWREKGAVTPVKDQGQCGSCWSFSATGALEGQHFRKTGKLVSLSEQNIIDCSHDFGNDGCHGGEVNSVFQYIKWQKGIDTEASYPYIGYERDPSIEFSHCDFKKEDIGATDVGYVNIKYADEEALKAAVATIGPISAAIYVNEWTWPFFHEGTSFTFLREIDFEKNVSQMASIEAQSCTFIQF